MFTLETIRLQTLYVFIFIKFTYVFDAVFEFAPYGLLISITVNLGQVGACLRTDDQPIAAVCLKPVSTCLAIAAASLDMVFTRPCGDLRCKIELLPG